MLRNLGIVWGVVKPTPQEVIDMELKSTQLELLEAEKQQEEAAAKVRLLTARVARLHRYPRGQHVSVNQSELDALSQVLKA